jgi:hypothetical protein
LYEYADKRDRRIDSRASLIIPTEKGMMRYSESQGLDFLIPSPSIFGIDYLPVSPKLLHPWNRLPEGEEAMWITVICSVQKFKIDSMLRGKPEYSLLYNRVVVIL